MREGKRSERKKKRRNRSSQEAKVVPRKNPEVWTDSRS